MPLLVRIDELLVRNDDFASALLARQMASRAALPSAACDEPALVQQPRFGNQRLTLTGADSIRL
jgi:hypothetical protein